MIFSINLFISHAHASENQAMNELVDLLKKMDTFKAKFVQNIKSSTGENISDTKGEVIIHRPNRFYWKSVRPDPILVVADGKYLWTYDIDLAQATKQQLNNALKDTPASLLAGSLDKFEKNFMVEYAKPGECKNSHGRCFLLKPKQKETSFKNILVGFNDHQIDEVRMSDPLGQNVKTIFSDVQLNQKAIDPKLFQFTPPKNVDVILYD